MKIRRRSRACMARRIRRDRVDGAGVAAELVVPIGKRLWTSSYALVTGGWSAVLLAGFYFLASPAADALGAPLVWIGGNALTIYLVSRLVDFNKVSAFLSAAKSRPDSTLGGPASVASCSRCPASRSAHCSAGSSTCGKFFLRL